LIHYDGIFFVVENNVIVVVVRQYQLKNDDDHELNKVDDEVKFENFVLVELMFD